MGDCRERPEVHPSPTDLFPFSFIGCPLVRSIQTVSAPRARANFGVGSTTRRLGKSPVRSRERPPRSRSVIAGRLRQFERRRWVGNGSRRLNRVRRDTGSQHENAADDGAGTKAGRASMKLSADRCRSLGFDHFPPGHLTPTGSTALASACPFDSSVGYRMTSTELDGEELCTWRCGPVKISVTKMR